MHEEGSNRYKDCVLNKEIKQQSLVNIQGVRVFRTSVQYFFSRLVTRCKTWFELSRVKLCRNDQKGNKTFFESAGSLCTTAPSSSETIGEGFELTNGKITVNI